jgi:broad specificity phosphatase PhoE
VATLLLARHGETDWNRDHQWQGHSGPTLNERGRRQARELARQVEDIHAIYSSDSERARETAEIVGANLGLSVRTDARLREVNFGEWEGLTRHEIDRLYAGAFTRWEACERPPPAGVEPDEVMAERALQALREIADRHSEGRILVVTSGGPIRAAQAHVRGIEQTIARRLMRTLENCALVELVIRDGLFEDRGDDRFATS